MQATLTSSSPTTINWIADGAYAAGEVVQLRDGRAAVTKALISAAGDSAEVYVDGTYTVLKTSSIVMLKGGKVYWDHSTDKCHYLTANDRDFFLGASAEDAAAAAETVSTYLNVHPHYEVDLVRDGFETVVVLTTGTADLLYRGNPLLKFSATAEAQKVDALSYQGWAKGSKFIVEGAFRIVDQGDAAALDLNIGVANATHATDADSITESLFIHVDGNTLDLKVESDDGSTEVAATDSTIDAVAGARVEFWFDARDNTDIQVYIDGSNVLPGSVFKLNAATGPLKLLAHMEKTSDATPGEVFIEYLRVRLAQ